MTLPRPFLVLLFACAAVACGRPQAATQNPAEDPAADQEEQVQRVKVAVVERGVVRRTIDAVANVESLDVVDVVAERAEPVLEILAEEGQKVSAGDPLARCRMTLAELAVDEAKVRLAEATNDLARARVDFQRNQSLAERSDGTSLLSDRDLETSKQALAAAVTAEASAQVALDRARIDLERCTLRAPITGTVTARDISVGDMTTIGQRAFEITDLEHPRVVFHRPQRELGQLRAGQPLTATAEAYPGIVITGRIERVAPVVDSASGTVKVTATLDAGEVGLIPTGLLLRLEIVLEERPDALLVPKDALILEGDQPKVFVVRGDRVHEVSFQPGFENPTHMEALGDALLEGDLVVVTGQDRLEEGDAVEILER